MTRNIASTSGCCKAPASLLLAIAHGLATGEHWWLMSSADRARVEWAAPAPTCMVDVAAAHKAAVAEDSRAPRVRVNGPALEWVPFSGGYFDDAASRRVVIHVEDGAQTGTIEWSVGAHKNEEEFKCSSFLASILVLLPGAEDDGTLTRYFEAGDREEARRIAAIRAAKAAGVARAVVNNSGMIVSEREMVAGGNFRHGWGPRRSWTLSGEERRYARWLRPDEIEALVASVEPLPWRAAE